MKTKHVFTLALAALMVTGLAAAVLFSVPQIDEKSIFELGAVKAPEYPKEFTAAAENIQTRFGKLEFPGGYPTD